MIIKYMSSTNSNWTQLVPVIIIVSCKCKYFSQSWSVNSEVPKVFSLRSHANIYIIKSRDIIITLKPVYTSIKLLYSDIVDCKQYCSTIIPTSNIINISIKIHQEEIEIKQLLIYFLNVQNISYWKLLKRFHLVSSWCFFLWWTCWLIRFPPISLSQQ